jgi:hypothetical protein
MGDWDRRNAGTLSVAISNFLKSGQTPVEQDFLVKDIYRDSRRAASSSLTDEEVLRQIRVRVCEICRGNGICVCDAASGWPGNCAFIKSNL